MTGIGRYTYEIVTRLPQNDIFEYYYYNLSIDRNFKKYTGISPDSLSIRIKKIITDNLFLKIAAKKIITLKNSMDRKTYDLYWEPSVIPKPTVKSKRMAVTVHDLSLRFFPQWHTKDNVQQFNKDFYKYINNADIVICDSLKVRQEIISELHIADDRVKAIHLGVDHDNFKIYGRKTLEEASKKLNLPEKFIFFSGSLEPRKNLVRLIQAYCSLPNDLKEEYKLIITGHSGWNNSEINTLIEREKNNIRHMGYLDISILPMVYNLASIFAYPSLYEGFGMPPLEAMACGVPVLASDTSCIPEVCGQAAYYVDPMSVESIREGIIRLAKDDGLRTALKSEGLKHCLKFTWDKTAAEHEAVFKNLVS